MVQFVCGLRQHFADFSPEDPNIRMKLIVLAAGFATRLHPLTLDRPKHLLEVAGRPIIESVLDHLRIKDIDHVYVVSNARFAARFEEWANRYRESGLPYGLTIFDDGATDESNKRGAIGDLEFLLTRYGITEHVIVVAGDNLFSEDLSGFGSFALQQLAPVLGVYDVGNLEDIKKYNSIRLDENGQILHFEEKPSQPTSTLTGIALYFYPASSLPLIHQYLAEGNNPDQPGRLVQWMFTRVPFYTWRVPGHWYDIGSLETLEEANRIFKDRPVTTTRRS
jgi:glucose-1-phosphate thymidylyltransferase